MIAAKALRKFLMCASLMSIVVVDLVFTVPAPKDKGHVLFYSLNTVFTVPSDVLYKYPAGIPPASAAVLSAYTSRSGWGFVNRRLSPDFKFKVILPISTSMKYICELLPLVFRIGEVYALLNWVP